MNKPKILTLDIETRPAVAYVWRMFDENIPNDRLIEPHSVLCVGMKWMGEKDTMMYSVWEHGRRGMLELVLERLNEADMIITYNGKKFDMQHLMAEFIINELPAPAPVTHVDLYQFVRNNTKFVSKKLDYVAQQLKVGSKQKHDGFGLWVQVMKGNKAAQRKMERYCAQDVRLTERVYEKLKGYIPNHPSLGFAGKEACPTCGSKRTQRRGHYFTRIYRWQRHQCTDCGSWFKTTQQKIKSNE